ncbi:MAG TPA: GntR family transcriptional regulator [Pseudonocardiaceae bacterium]|jgi:DNA-binding GntR family transcriptional regulator|nr:GntR family transcriptional regulator [Pseudonocardiaceae bacterium]
MTDATSDLRDDRVLLERTSTAERVADILRTRIIEGYFRPGNRLSEETIVGDLEISRNTLREAFRLLSHERLLRHELHRGVSVRKLSVADVIDLYRVRKAVECATVRALVAGQPGIPAIEAAVVDGERAADAGDWQQVGTANLRYHQAVVALADSPRLDELMRGVLAELRLVFHVMSDTRRFYEPYLARNRQILGRIQAGDGEGADRLLAVYLDDAERQLVEAYTEESRKDAEPR